MTERRYRVTFEAMLEFDDNEYDDVSDYIHMKLGDVIWAELGDHITLIEDITEESK